MHKFFAKTEYLGKKVIFLPECHSTNEEAQSLLANEAVNEGTCILTHHQTKGKGQRGNSWESKPGQNITFSIILSPKSLKPSNQFALHMVSSLAVHDALFPILGKKLKVKWPNDIYYENLKIGGILIENVLRGNKIESSTVGIGVNVNQTTFEYKSASSLQEITQQDFEINDLIEKIILALEKRYEILRNENYDELRSIYLRRLYLFEERAPFLCGQSRFTGIIQGIDDSGRLIVKEGNTNRTFDFKEIQFVQ